MKQSIARAAFLTIAAFFVFAVSANAQPATDPTAVTLDAQGAILRSATSCDAYNAPTVANVWANAPAEVLLAANGIIWQVRYVEIHNVTESATPYTTGFVAYRVGPNTNTPVLTLTAGKRIFGGGAIQVQTRRPTISNALVGTAWPSGPVAIWVLPQSNVTLCVTYYW